MTAFEDALPLIGVLVGAGVAYLGSARQSNQAYTRQQLAARFDSYERFAQAAKSMQRTLYRLAAGCGLPEHNDHPFAALTPEIEATMAADYAERDTAFETISLHDRTDIERAARDWVQGLIQMRSVYDQHTTGSRPVNADAWSKARGQVEAGRTAFRKAVQAERG